MVSITFESLRRHGACNTSNKRTAVEARVRRALAREGEVMRKPRSDRERRELGDYFTVNAHTGFPERGWLNLDELARECGVLHPDAVIEE
jgi:hypothetical protein